MTSMRRAWSVLVVMCACPRSSPAPEQPPPHAETDAFVPLAEAPHPSHVVWIGATGGLEIGETEPVWKGGLPETRVPIANLDTLVATIAPRPHPVPIDGSHVLARARIIELARRGNPWSIAQQVNPSWEPKRGYERLPASVGSRSYPAPLPLVLASPTTPAAAVVEIAARVGARLGVAQPGYQVATLRMSFRRVVDEYVQDDTRERWVELHLGAAQIDVLSLPSNRRVIVPWKDGTIDSEALRAIYKGFGMELIKLDVFVDQAVTYQRLIDTLVALDDLGISALGLGKTPGRVDDRLGQVVALRAARVNQPSKTAVIEVGLVMRQGEIEEREIYRVLRTRLADLTACYEPELAKHPALQGRVDMRFLISSAGKLVQPTASGLPVVAPCTTRKLRGLVFPRPKNGGAAQVAFIVVFRPKDS
jgi:hypothetical protein